MNNMLYTTVANPIPKELRKDDLLLDKTVKEDHRLHGYGHKIIAQIIKEHNGTMLRSVKNGIFEIEIMMEL